MSKKKITMEEVMKLVKTGRYDEYGHLLITNKTYTSYCDWFMGTLSDHKRQGMLDMKTTSPSSFKSYMCNFIAASFHSLTGDVSPITTVCVHYTNGSYDYVNVKM